MNVRRTAAVLAVTAVLGAAAAPAVADDASPSPSPSVAIPSGLYGDTDPAYDGVWRQSLALTAQDLVGEKPAAQAVDWLVGQQCSDGAFPAYRADTTAQCDAQTQVDTNSTAAAVQALAALGGHDAETVHALRWLKDAQNDDGGWGYTTNGPSDANSTSVVIGALAAVGDDPEEQRSAEGNTPYDALRALAVPCGEEDGGAFAYQPDAKGALTANADATAAAVLGSLGKGFAPGAGESGAAGAAECVDGDDASPADAARGGAAHLTEAMAKDGYLTSVLPGAEDQPDYGNTADAVVALAAAGATGDTAEPLARLKEHGPAWAAGAGPAAYAQLVFAAHATGTDPRDFGGTDLVKALNATGPQPEAAESAAAEETSEEDGSALGITLIVAAFLVAGLGIGIFLSLRGRKRRP
ncbi:prenyltransferase/squalene oxidase repeat-containing protein [Streptomyces sp. CRN 30]|uniref:prenyltransferase/squalene oxidase repeat-containing protein n=1 Tax=Streptomyces sp. CRN 30 TaxID=3075613 RepID=UPI002A8194EE|nr:prenyltransferase/squalene oxidase repeat-containing protein [Streptomyces sp. CRN 30]